MTIAILAGVFLLLLFLNVPVAFAIGLSALAAMLCSVPFEPSATALAQRIAMSTQSFALLAIPFFILAGQLMARGGLARRLIDFAKIIAGPIPGALAITNVISNMLFGAVSGSATAAASGIGGFMIPAMERDRYDRAFAAATSATSATCGLLIPPSNVMIVYAMVASGVSVGTLFVAGYIPGILLGLCILAVGWVIALRKGYGTANPVRPTSRQVLGASLGILPVAVLIVIVMGGIVKGIFTPTEASAVAVVYAFVMARWVYGEVKWSDTPAVLLETASTTGLVFLLIGASVGMSWIFAYADVPQTIERALRAFSSNPYVVIILINLILLFVGTFMDMTPAILIFTPVFGPIMASLAPAMGITPVEMSYHFGIVMILNLCIGLCTPPVGTVLFLTCSVARIGIRDILPPMWWLFGAMFTALMLISCVPAISLWLPRILHLL